MVTCSTTDVIFIFWIRHFQLETSKNLLDLDFILSCNIAFNNLLKNISLFLLMKDAQEIDQLINYLINKENSEGVVLLGHSTGCQVIG